MYGEIRIFGGRAPPSLTTEICDVLGLVPGRSTAYNFSDGETFVQIDENVRQYGKHLDLRYTTMLAGTNACNVTPQAGDLGIADARIIAAGDASRSVLVARMNRRDAPMPPLASTVVDAAGVNLVAGWINSLTACN